MTLWCSLGWIRVFLCQESCTRTLPCPGPGPAKGCSPLIYSACRGSASSARDMPPWETSQCVAVVLCVKLENRPWMPCYSVVWLQVYLQIHYCALCLQVRAKVQMKDAVEARESRCCRHQKLMPRSNPAIPCSTFGVASTISTWSIRGNVAL